MGNFHEQKTMRHVCSSTSNELQYKTFNILLPNTDKSSSYLPSFDKVCIATPFPHTNAVLAEHLGQIYELAGSESLTAFDFTEAFRVKGDMTFPVSRLFSEAFLKKNTQAQQLGISGHLWQIKGEKKQKTKTTMGSLRSTTSNKSFR